MKLEKFIGKVEEKITKTEKFGTKYIVRFRTNEERGGNVVDIKVRDYQYPEFDEGRTYEIESHYDCKKTWTNKNGITMCCHNFVLDAFKKVDVAVQNELDGLNEKEAIVEQIKTLVAQLNK